MIGHLAVKLRFDWISLPGILDVSIILSFSAIFLNRFWWKIFVTYIEPWIAIKLTVIRLNYG